MMVGKREKEKSENWGGGDFIRWKARGDQWAAAFGARVCAVSEEKRLRTTTLRPHPGFRGRILEKRRPGRDWPLRELRLSSANRGPS